MAKACLSSSEYLDNSIVLRLDFSNQLSDARVSVPPAPSSEFFGSFPLHFSHWCLSFLCSGARSPAPPRPVLWVMSTGSLHLLFLPACLQVSIARWGPGSLRPSSLRQNHRRPFPELAQPLCP